MNALGHQVYERGDILLNQYENVEEENQAIVNQIKNLIGVEFKDKLDSESRGLDYGDMVILVIKWKKAQPIIEALENGEDVEFPARHFIDQKDQGEKADGIDESQHRHRRIDEIEIAAEH